MPQRDKGLPLDIEETDVDHRQMTVYKGKGETQRYDPWLILIGHVS